MSQKLWQEDARVQLRAALNHQDTSTFHALIQTILGGYSILEPTHTQHTPYIQPKDLSSSKKLQKGTQKEKGLKHN